MELTQRSLAAPRERVEPHQPTVRLLVEGLLEQHLLEGNGGGTMIAGQLMETSQLDEEAHVPLAQHLPTRRHPIVEAILREKLTAIQAYRGLIARERRLELRLRRRRLERFHVDPKPLGAEDEEVTRVHDPRRPIITAEVERPASHEQCLAQVVRRGTQLSVRPKRLDRALAMQAVLRGQREELDQLTCIAKSPRGLIHRPIGRGHAKPAEKIDAQRRSRLS